VQEKLEFGYGWFGRQIKGGKGQKKERKSS